MESLKYHINEIEDKGPWTQFWDMNSDGRQKEKYKYIHIQANQKLAELIFYNIFKHNPNRITCTCCSEDYFIEESKSLSQLTGFHRNCYYDQKTKTYLEKPEYNSNLPVIPLLKFINKNYVLAISKSQIKKEWKIGKIPKQGYIWID